MSRSNSLQKLSAIRVPRRSLGEGGSFACRAEVSAKAGHSSISVIWILDTRRWISQPITFH